MTFFKQNLPLFNEACYVLHISLLSVTYRDAFVANTSDHFFETIRIEYQTTNTVPLYLCTVYISGSRQYQVILTISTLQYISLLLYRMFFPPIRHVPFSAQFFWISVNDLAGLMAVQYLGEVTFVSKGPQVTFTQSPSFFCCSSFSVMDYMPR